MDLLDIFGLAFIFMTALFCILASFYLYAYYAQPLEKDFRGTWSIRVLIILGMAATLFTIFLVPIDMMANFKP